VIEVREYVLENGESPFRDWFDELDPQEPTISALRRWRDYKVRKSGKRN
jgi:hypothetical protein